MNYTIYDLEWIVRKRFSEDDINRMTNVELLSHISEALGLLLTDVLYEYKHKSEDDY